jgi:hypothetical protein
MTFGGRQWGRSKTAQMLWHWTSRVNHFVFWHTNKVNVMHTLQKCIWHYMDRQTWKPEQFIGQQPTCILRSGSMHTVVSLHLEAVMFSLLSLLGYILIPITVAMQFQTCNIFDFWNFGLMDWNQSCSKGGWQCFIMFCVGKSLAMDWEINCIYLYFSW